MRRELILSCWSHAVLSIIVLLFFAISPLVKIPRYQVNKVNLVNVAQLEEPRPVKTLPPVREFPKTVRPKAKKELKKPIKKKSVKKHTRKKKSSAKKIKYKPPEKSLRKRLQEKMQSKEARFVEPETVFKRTATRPRTVVTTDNFPFQWYLDLLRNKISSNWNIAALKNISKKNVYADCSFLVNRNGTVDDIRIVKSSGYHHFDESIMMAVKASIPIPPLPDKYIKKELKVKIRFELE